MCRLQEKLDLERGATHTPAIDDHSRRLAAVSSSRSFGSDDDDVFIKLHRDAERRHLKNEVTQSCELSAPEI